MRPNAVAKQPKRRSIGTHLMWAVNLPLVVVLAVLLPLDFRRELDNAIAQKHASLENVAMTIYQGLSCLAQDSRQEHVQRYIDAVCADMQESRSPGHHIAIRWKDSVLQAAAHHRASTEIVRTMQQAAKSPSHRATLGDETLVVGTFTGDSVDVYVAEYTTDIRASIQTEILIHFVWLLALAAVAAAIVNAVLWWIVTRPVIHLSNTVSHIAQGDYELRSNGFRSREMNKLSAAIQQMSDTLAANERGRSVQLERARRIQENLLPNGVTIPGLAVARLFRPADEVAGDYYDLIRLPDDNWLLCMADVAGHGVAAAMGSAILKSVVLQAAERYGEPRKILRFVNERLPRLLTDEFITLFLARWNSESQRLDYASAGHEPGILLSPCGELRELQATGLPLGVDRNADWEAETIDFSSGYRLLLATDGVTEARDPGDTLFGRKRPAELLGNRALSPEQVVAAIRDAVLAHQQGQRASDDITILVLESGRGEEGNTGQ